MNEKSHLINTYALVGFYVEERVLELVNAWTNEWVREYLKKGASY